MPRRHIIAVCGSGRLDHNDPRRKLSFELGRAIVDAGWRVLCGGLGGVMEEVARGARSSPSYQTGDIVGVLPGRDASEANQYIDVAVPTGLGHLRNGIVAGADALVAVGGGAGTLSEIALAWIHDRPIVAYKVNGWSGRLAGERIDDRTRFSGHPEDRVHAVHNAEQAVRLLRDLLTWEPVD